MTGAVVAVVSILAVGCGPPSYPGEPLETLPPHTIGAVSLGGLGVETSGGRTLVFTFDDQGTVLGRIEGERVDSTQVLFSDDSLVTVTGRAPASGGRAGARRDRVATAGGTGCINEVGRLFEWPSRVSVM